MKITLINVLKAAIFYSTIIVCVLTLMIDVDYTPFSNVMTAWAISGFMAFITYLMCKGKTTAEIKEFTGIDFDKE